ncbi:MAG: twin-arginine translocase subunit TatC [Tatlockia sp.]|nr:twin-arginine translocase subunit TatC [Tatlockia sp.]
MLCYLLELRRRAIYTILFFFLVFLVFFSNANTLFTMLISPLLAILPDTNFVIATQITSPVLTPLKLAANLAIVFTTPFALLQLWLFVAPGLYQQECSHLKTAICSILLLFCLGILFCFYVILPMMFQFFAKATPSGVRFMPDISNTVDFITRMLILFGLCFQIPIIGFTLVRMNWVKLAVLKKIRPYIIVTSFVIGMLVTPDIFSQIILAIPLCLLYEVGIILATLGLGRARTYTPRHH